MKKIFTWLVLIICPFIAFADEVVRVDTVQMRKTLEILNSVEGFVFLEQGESKSRELSETFARTDSVAGSTKEEFEAMDWKVYNSNIVEITPTGKVTGVNYGETIVEMKDSEKSHYFFVFVCPTVSVISPDGVVYTHQKIYNQKMKIDFTPSKNYCLNCVMASYGGNVYDITHKIDPQGHYESNDQITSDVYYTISFIESPDNSLIKDTPIKLRVSSDIVEVETSEDYKGDKSDWTITINKFNSDEETVTLVGDGCFTYDGGDFPRLDASFTEGIYFVTINDTISDYKFKIVVKKL